MPTTGSVHFRATPTSPSVDCYVATSPRSLSALPSHARSQSCRRCCCIRRRRFLTEKSCLQSALFFLRHECKSTHGMLKQYAFLAFLFAAAGASWPGAMTKMGAQRILRDHCCASSPNYDACATVSLGGISYSCDALRIAVTSSCCDQPASCVTVFDGSTCGGASCGTLPAVCTGDTGSGEGGSGDGGSGDQGSGSGE